MIGLLDANSFYASCERIFRPDLWNRPVVVLSNNDGCIIARSREAKQLGIPMGAPYFKVRFIIDQHKVAVFSSNFALYGDISARMMHIIRDMVPRLEIYSIDEAFFDLSGVEAPLALAQALQERLQQWLGMPTSIGISLTKTLAKVANHKAKQEDCYQGVCLLHQEPDLSQALRACPVEDLWGVGKRLAHHLKAHGIYTAFDLRHVSPAWMRQRFTVVGERLVRELNGVGCLQLHEIASPKQSIRVSRSFASLVYTYDTLEQLIARYTIRLGEKLRAQGRRAAHLTVFIRTNRFSPTQRQYYNEVSVPLSPPTHGTPQLLAAARKALTAIYQEGYGYHKAGVLAWDLTPETMEQGDLFPAAAPAQNQLMRIVDRLNNRLGKGTISFASCGSGRPLIASRRENKSPAYTTQWSDLAWVRG